MLAYTSPLTAQTLETLTVDGKDRTMLVHAPKDLPENPPLVISLHGANQDAHYQLNQTHWDVCADTAKFVVVLPNAINKFWDTGGTSDIKFLRTIISRMHERYNVNLDRVYLTGFSLGGMMTYVCMQKMGNEVAAFGPVSGVPFDNRAPSAPRRVPFIHTHGTGDNVFWWTGDMNHAAGGYPAITDYVRKWAAYEGMDETPEITSPYPKNRPDSQATLTRWTTDDSDIEIALLQIEGKGHWHSEDINAGVSTTQEIWNFCKRYSLVKAPVDELAITADMWHKWIGVGADAVIDAADDNPDAVVNLNTDISVGGVVAGQSTGSVRYFAFADLTPYAGIYVKGDAGMNLRFLFNRPEDNPDGSESPDFVEVVQTIPESGEMTIDFATAVNSKTGQPAFPDGSYVHLLCCKNNWGSITGRITKFNVIERSTAGISNAVAAERTSATYDLAGKRVTPDYKGIVIMNGRKICRQ